MGPANNKKKEGKFQHLRKRQELRATRDVILDIKSALKLLCTYSRLQYLPGGTAGVVWCGVVWCGMVWCGVAWCAVCCRYSMVVGNGSDGPCDGDGRVIT